VHTPSGGTDGTVELPAETSTYRPTSAAAPGGDCSAGAARQGTLGKSRGEVRGWRRQAIPQEKGTGRAGRVDRAPQFTGGAWCNGPVPRKYDQRTPKKMKVAQLVAR